MGEVQKILERMIDSRAHDRQEIYRVVCEAEKDTDTDFKGVKNLREFLMLYLEGVVPYELVFDAKGNARTKAELCKNLKDLPLKSLKKSINKTSMSIWRSAFRSSVGSFADNYTYKLARDSYSKWQDMPDLKVNDSVWRIGAISLLFGAISAVITAGSISVRGIYRRIVSRAKKAMVQAQSNLEALENQVRARKPHLDFEEIGISSVEQARVEISKNPRYSIFVLVRPDGTLRSKIEEIEKAYGVYVDSLLI